MGPRPNGRGKWTSINASSICRRCVNGAAAKRPRKAGSVRLDKRVGKERQWGRGQTAAESFLWHGRGQIYLCVNGAAAKRPRKAAQWRAACSFA